ncbi:cupredoxin family copper-binding protein [Rhodanobacter sp. MP7CTX1]|uniref:cupredoxin domain-containing protein n=1 Tax=Rhodanobacter sp. MP7CTX1 TaxID=2723084 RepID=UPI0017B7DECD|nr:cupredoxin family copper-binding protein [Rhodanobacter sp. MP7CTX1]MBB6187943.1 amicyanin [Rhodanobacter sp. MP7CTX1]
MKKTMTLPNIRRYGMSCMTACLWLLSATFSVQASTPTQGVDISKMAFRPGDMTVKPGTKVTWTNRDQIPHTVTSKDKGGVLTSQGLDTGDSYSYTFTQPGDYVYFCTVHPFMIGVVHVRK